MLIRAEYRRESMHRSHGQYSRHGVRHRSLASRRGERHRLPVRRRRCRRQHPNAPAEGTSLPWLVLHANMCTIYSMSGVSFTIDTEAASGLDEIVELLAAMESAVAAVALATARVEAEQLWALEGRCVDESVPHTSLPDERHRRWTVVAARQIPPPLRIGRRRVDVVGAVTWARAGDATSLPESARRVSRRAPTHRGRRDRCVAGR